MTSKSIDTIVTPREFKSMLEQYLNSTDSCIVHTSLSAFGYIPGGEQTVVEMLKEILHNGTIMMAAQTVDLSDPVDWEDPPVIKEQQVKLRKSMPYYTKNSPIHYIGVTPEYFRTSKDVFRTNHPIYSVCVWGKDAQKICRNREYDDPFGVHSPLQDMYDRNAKIVMLGTDYESCTALHLADSTIDRPLIQEEAPIKGKNGKTKWIKFKIPDDYDKYDDFNKFGEYFEQKYSKLIQKTKIKKGYLKVVPMRPLVDEARKYYHNKDAQQGN